MIPFKFFNVYWVHDFSFCIIEACLCHAVSSVLKAKLLHKARKILEDVSLFITRGFAYI